MKHVLYATSNAIKLQFAQKAAGEFELQVKQVLADVPEIQSEEGAVIAQDKAQKIFDIVKQPLVVSDDSWIIPGLKGFPGPYMKSVNHWFTPEDWLRLTAPLKDRRIILRQFAVYQDARTQKTFCTDLEGTLLTEIRGKAPFPHMALVSYDGGKTSAAETFSQKGPASLQVRTSWHDLCEWLVSAEGPYGAE